MKFFLLWLKGRMPLILLFLGCFLIFTISFMLYHLPLQAVLYPGFLCLFLLLAAGIFDYQKERKLTQQLEEEKEKLIQEPAFKARNPVEKGYQSFVNTLFEENARLKTESDALIKENEAYYTLWVHQIKTPIAAMDAALQNEDSSLARQIQRNILQVSNYIDMAMAFVRLHSDQSDYRFEPVNLDEVIEEILSRYAMEFIDRGIGLDYQPVLKESVSDKKWVSLMIEQLLSNALKYSKSGTIHISWQDGLLIRDEGIGISQEDLSRVFEKGFTGQNGRKDRYSSGLGLWLVSRIAKNLRIQIQAQSRIKEGTGMKLIFNNYRDLTEL